MRDVEGGIGTGMVDHLQNRKIRQKMNLGIDGRVQRQKNGVNDLVFARLCAGRSKNKQARGCMDEMNGGKQHRTLAWKVATDALPNGKEKSRVSQPTDLANEEASPTVGDRHCTARVAG